MMFYIADLGVLVLLMGLLLLKRDKLMADWILILWFCFILIHLLLLYVHISELINPHPFLVGYILPLPLIYGPFLFLYVSALTRRLPLKKYLALFHFLPFLCAYLYLIPFLSLPGLRKLYIINHQGIGYEGFFRLNRLLIIISGIAYITASLWIIKKSRQLLTEEFYNLKKINPHQLRFLACGLGIGWILLVTGNKILIFMDLVIYAFYMGFLGFKHAGKKEHNHPPATFN